MSSEGLTGSHGRDGHPRVERPDVAAYDVARRPVVDVDDERDDDIVNRTTPCTTPRRYEQPIEHDHAR